MPLWEVQCEKRHSLDIFAHDVAHRDRRIAEGIACPMCGDYMALHTSFGKGLTYFSSKGGGRVIHNLGAEPVTITSTKQHERIMKEQGVTWAPNKRGMPGCWS